MRWKQLTYYLWSLLLVTACVIEDDIPYPIQVGDIVDVVVLGVDEKRHRISLSMKQAKKQ